MIVKIRDMEIEFGKKTLIMGILNITPDSFSDGGQYNNLSAALDRAKRFISEGVDILDLGGESTRPGHTVITEEEEINRVVPIIRAIRSDYDIPISIDTYKSKVARAGLEAGCQIVNDVWGFQFDDDMAPLCAEYGAYCVLMHNAKEVDPNRDIMAHMMGFFRKTIEIAHAAGIRDEMICIDPGIGFGKTVEQNIEAIRRLDELKNLGFPVLLGTSRKSMIGKIQNSEIDDRLEGTIATNIIGLTKGVDIIRVHDVLEHQKAFKVADAILR